MATVTLTKDNFNETLQDNPFVILDFWAEWCGPCKAFAPVFQKASEKHSDIVFGKVDTEDQQELAASFQIQSIPTLMVVRDQVVIFSQPGALPESVFEDLIDKAREVNMDEVRAKVAEEQGSDEAQGNGS